MCFCVIRDIYEYEYICMCARHTQFGVQSSRFSIISNLVEVRFHFEIFVFRISWASILISFVWWIDNLFSACRLSIDVCPLDFNAASAIYICIIIWLGVIEQRIDCLFAFVIRRFLSIDFFVFSRTNLFEFVIDPCHSWTTEILKADYIFHMIRVHAWRKWISCEDFCSFCTRV